MIKLSREDIESTLISKYDIVGDFNIWLSQNTKTYIKELFECMKIFDEEYIYEKITYVQIPHSSTIFGKTNRMRKCIDLILECFPEMNLKRWKFVNIRLKMLTANEFDNLLTYISGGNITRLFKWEPETINNQYHARLYCKKHNMEFECVIANLKDKKYNTGCVCCHKEGIRRHHNPTICQNIIESDYQANIVTCLKLKKFKTYHQAQGRKQKKSEIDDDWIITTLQQCNFRCMYSNIDFDLDKKWLHPSFERIDSSKDYTKENTIIVCVVLNLMKHELSMEEFKRGICSIAENNMIKSDMSVEHISASRLEWRKENGISKNIPYKISKNDYIIFNALKMNTCKLLTIKELRIHPYNL